MPRDQLIRRRCVMSARIKGLHESVGESDWKPLIDDFVLDCHIRNLMSKSIDVYAERLTYSIGWWSDKV